MIEPITGLEIGVWFTQAEHNVFAYKGTVAALIQFAPKTSEHRCSQYVVSRCPRCEQGRLMREYPVVVTRWMLLPP